MTDCLDIQYSVQINKEDCILDIGIKSCINLENIIENSKILIWNGPIGFYEEQYFSIGSLYIARAIAYNTKKNNLVSIIGGGDAVAVAKLSGLKDYFSYISSQLLLVHYLTHLNHRNNFCKNISFLVFQL